ncbi:hypothetical protein ACFFGH_13830 [Lysobacter korlensis]|uniref:Uncharacterized protein n=1 Tax=Lysobacter korlensis TaxID=553636 RepID=A0ABV6RPL0_9GAMM
MAQIDIERKKEGSPWKWLIIIALILLAIWALWEMFDREEVEAPVAPAAVVAPAAPATQPINAPIVSGQPVALEASVLEVPTDRVFIVSEGSRTLAVVVKQTPNMEQAVNVNPGQFVRFTGTFYNTADLAQIEGELAPQARDIVQRQAGVVLVEASQINVAEAAAAAGTQ